MQNYILCELMGNGADGKVYRAIRKFDNQSVCLKQIAQNKGAFQKDSGRNEVAAYQKISHPNIPTFFEHFVHDKTLNIVIEMADGYPLRNIIYTHKTRKDPISEDRILHFFGQMVSILMYFKKLSMIYCDIKPENIIMDDKGDIKLIDFGTAKITSTKLKKSFSFGGTLAYMSPEMLGETGYSFETDVWSLGVLLHEMMTRFLPFGMKNEKDVVRKIQNAEPPEVKGDYSAALKNTVKSMLKKKPHERITIEALAKLDFIPKVSSELTVKQWNNIGLKHNFGLGVKKNIEEARKYFKMAAEAGLSAGMFNYCFSILNTDKRAEALEYLKQSAEAGNPDGVFNYAVALDQGWSGRPNLPEAMKYYGIAADRGNLQAMCNYAIALTEGWDGEPDIPKAVSYYRVAAERGDPFAMLNFANALAGGLQGPPNYTEAMRYYKMSADGGNADAAFNYGAGMLHGWSGKPEPASAMKYFKMAADKGNMSALYNYAIGLEMGHAGNPDPAAAAKFFKTAADAGHEEAKAAYSRIAQSRLPNLHRAPSSGRVA
jgi:serine/threonine protein kinase